MSLSVERTKLVLVKLENVSKTFVDKKVLDGVSLEIDDQSFTSILGPPGAGKTTLLRIIAGVEAPDDGKIYFDEREVTGLSARDRKVAMVYQSFALYPHMRVYDNIASPLKVMKLPADEIDRKVKSIAEVLGIHGLLGRYPRELSGGEAQRVAIARSLTKEATVYLLDEPLTNLDYKLRESMRGELRRIFKERGGTIIYATPDPLDTLALAQYVAVIRDGKIEQYGSVQEVYDRPKNSYIGRYFSFPPMNFIDSELVVRKGKHFLQALGFSLEVTHPENILSERLYVLGIRPNKIRILTEETENIISIPLEVIITEIIGSETLVHLKYSDTRLVAHAPSIVRYEPGEKIMIGFDPNDLYIFSQETGELITQFSK